MICISHTAKSCTADTDNKHYSRTNVVSSSVCTRLTGALGNTSHKYYTTCALVWRANAHTLHVCCQLTWVSGVSKCMGVLHVVKTEFADALGEARYDRAVAL